MKEFMINGWELWGTMIFGHTHLEDLGFKFPPKKKSRFARNKWDLFYLILANN